jgi:hypothetical protein
MDKCNVIGRRRISHINDVHTLVQLIQEYVAIFVKKFTWSGQLNGAAAFDVGSDLFLGFVYRTIYGCPGHDLVFDTTLHDTKDQQHDH